MAKDLALAEGIETDADFPRGVKLLDGQTVVGEHINQDIIQFFWKLMKDHGGDPNGLNDNEVNGYQFVNALKGYVLNTMKPYTHVFYKKVIPIGEWNMDSTETVSIPHGLSLNELGRVANVNIVIYNDIIGIYTFKKAFNFFASTNFEVSGSYEFGNTDISLRRKTSGFFDSIAFSGAMGSTPGRGIITIDYIDDVYFP